MPDIKLISTTAMKRSLDDTAAEIRARNRSQGRAVLRSLAAPAKQIGEGEVSDAAIVGAQNIEDLVKQGKIAAGSAGAIARSPIALAVQKGAPKPDISTAEKFKQALLAAKSIAMSNPVGGGTSGGILMRAFERLGIADAIKPQADVRRGRPCRPCRPLPGPQGNRDRHPADARTDDGARHRHRRPVAGRRAVRHRVHRRRLDRGEKSRRARRRCCNFSLHRKPRQWSAPKAWAHEIRSI